MAISNINAKINITVGNVSAEKVLFEINLYNSHSKTQKISQEISGSTGVQPNNNQVWIHVEGLNSAALKDKAEEIGVFGSPATYGAGSGAWAQIDLNVLRESGMPIPVISEIPFLAQSLPGDSHIELKFLGATTPSEALAIQQAEAYAAITLFFSNFIFKLDAHGDSATIENGFQMLNMIFDGNNKKVGSIKDFCASLTEASLNLKLGSWRDFNPVVNEHFDKAFKDHTIYNLMKPEVAGILAGVGELFEKNFRVLLLINDSCYAEIKIRIPGLVDWAMSQMEQ